MSEQTRAYNTFSSAYTRRTGTATSRSTAVGNHPYANIPHQQYDPRSDLLPPRPAFESRVFGLAPDLSEATTPTQDDVENVTRMSRLLHDQKPSFSVQVVAPSFDDRGYPVLSGRAASIRGVVRMSAKQRCDVRMSISAHTTSGSPAALWQGVALAPWTNGAEKKIFEINDRLTAGPSTDNSDVVSIPFDVNLPLGQSTRFVDGEAQTVPVALPPSFEISSKAAQQEKRDIRLATKGKSKGPLAKELLEKGFEKVYRIGCYYQITWTLLRDDGASDTATLKKGKGGAVKEEKIEGDTLTLPFVFLGEPTSMPPHPTTLPDTISPEVLIESGTALGDQWNVHKSQAKWSGTLLRASRRTVDIELHLPSPSVLQSPSVLPMMVILRPADPALLSPIPSRSMSGSSTAPTSPLVGQLEDPMEIVASKSREDSDTSDAASMKTSRSIMSKLINPGKTRSIFGRRPKTAPSPGSSEAGASEARTDRTYMPQGTIPDLVGLVCVSLIQTAFSSNDNVNDGPEHRRKLLSFADLEEVDARALLLNSDSTGSQPGSRPGTARSDQELATIQEAVSAAKASGLRVLVGSLKIAGTTAPSFRSQGLEVKYALKVDLLPANRMGNGDAMNSAFRNLGLGSQMFGSTASMHTQTQFSALSNDNTASPPMTPPWQTNPVAFGSEGDIAARPYPTAFGSRTGSPNALTAPPAMSGVGSIDATAETAESARVQSHASKHQASRSAGTPFVYSGSSAASSRWESGASVSDTSGIQSSIYLSEWGRDRKTVTKLNKSIGEMWLDIRVVRGQMFS